MNEYIPATEGERVNRPFASIGMPAFNEANYISSAIESILAQDFVDFELLISDNGSTDNTLEIAKSYALRDRRIAIYTQSPPLSALENFRFLLAQAKADYFMFAGAHDLWSSNYLKALLATLNSSPNAKLAVPDTIYIDDKSEISGKPLQHIDTRDGQSESARAFSLYRTMNRCNAFYGLFDRKALTEAMGLPYRIVNLDFLVLMQVAARGDIISCHQAIWYRRNFRIESKKQKNERHASIFKTRGWSLRFPLIFSRLISIRMFAGLKGNFCERFSLVLYALWKMVFHPSQLRIILRELISKINEVVR